VYEVLFYCIVWTNEYIQILKNNPKFKNNIFKSIFLRLHQNVIL